MKRLLAVPVALLAACAGHPDPYPLKDLEGMDPGFASPPPIEARPALDRLLKQEALSLEDLLVLTDLLHPGLAAERRNVDLATAAMWDAGLYPNPYLILEIEDYRPKDGATLGKTERKAGVSIPLVLSGRLGAASSLADKEREGAAVRFVWRRREVLSGVKRAFVALMTARQSESLARETRELAKSLHQITEQRFQAQAVPEMELLKSAVNLAKSESDLRLAEKSASVAQKSLLGAVGNVDLPKESFTGSLGGRFSPPTLEALRGQVTTFHPLLEAARRGREAAELELDLARSERFGDPELTALVGRNPEDETIVEGGLTLPLPIFTRNRGKIAKAEIRVQQADLEIDAVRNDLGLRLTEAYRSFTAGLDRVQTYRDDILPKAEKIVVQTNLGYASGKFGYLDVLDAQRTLSEARTSFASALGDLNLSVVDLEQLTGSRIEPLR